MSSLISRRLILRGALLGVGGPALASVASGCARSSVPAGGQAPTSGHGTSPTSAASPGSSSTSAGSPGSSSTTADNVLTVGPATGPAVLLLHSWWGIGPAVQAWANILAGAGHRVLIPDMFGGRTAGTAQEAEALVASVGQEQSRAMTERCADGLAARGRPWAVLGFSLGAMFACRLAGRGQIGPDEVHLFYGGGDPGGEVSRTRRAHLHVVPNDEYFTADEIAQTERFLTRARVDVRTFTYPASRHWFAERGTPGFDEKAFQLARSRVLADVHT